MSERPFFIPYLLALLPVALVVGIALIGINKTIHAPESGPPKGEREGIGELVGTSRACQTFLAQYDNLSQIKVQLDNLGRKNESTFTFALRTKPNAAQDLVTLTVDASTINTNIYHTFAFPPIPDSKDKSYAFCLEAPETGLDQAITAMGTLEDTYPHGQAHLRDMWGAEAGVQDLDFHLGYRLSLWQTVPVLLDRVTESKPYLCGARWFYAALGILYLAGLYTLFVRFGSRKVK